MPDLYPRGARDADGEPIFVRFRQEECWIDFAGRYAAPEGQDAGGWIIRLRMRDAALDETDVMCTATVHIDLSDEYETAQMLASGFFVLIKDCDDNAGVLAALVGAGVLEDTGERVGAESTPALLCHLLVATPEGPPLAQVLRQSREIPDKIEGYLDRHPELLEQLRDEAAKLDPQGKVRVFLIAGEYFMALDEAGAIEAFQAKFGETREHLLDPEEVDQDTNPPGEELTWRDVVLENLGRGNPVPCWIGREPDTTTTI